MRSKEHSDSLLKRLKTKRPEGNWGQCMIAESFPRIRKTAHTSNQVKKSLKLVVESLSTSIKPPIKRHLCGWKQTHRCKPVFTLKCKNFRPGCNRKHLNKPVQFYKKKKQNLWTDETKTNLYQNDRKEKHWKGEKQLIIIIYQTWWRQCYGMRMGH